MDDELKFHVNRSDANSEHETPKQVADHPEQPTLWKPEHPKSHPDGRREAALRKEAEQKMIHAAKEAIADAKTGAPDPEKTMEDPGSAVS